MIASSRASARRILGGALASGARRVASRTRAEFLDRAGEAHEDVVDQGHFVGGIAVRIVQQQVGEVARHFRAALAGALHDGAFDFVQQCEFGIHEFDDHILWLATIGRCR